MGADGVPDVVFVTYRQNDFPGTNGVLRIVSGVDGTELVTVTDPDLRLASFGQIAVGDIDLDGLPEILARDDGQGLLMAFEHDGTHKWTGPDVDLLSSGQWGGPSIVNLDADPEPDIVFGRAAFDNTGALMWRGTGGRETIKGPLSLIADIDQTFPPEIIAGNTIYNADGTIRYQNLTLSDGLNALGNFDADPEPEIVHVANGEIHLLEHDLSVIWGPVVFPVTPINGGIPIVGDFDGDGAPEIGVSELERFYVFDSDGTLLWDAFTQENSHGNGASAFDFDGDSALEVLYADAVNLHILDGRTGAIRFITELGNVTAYEAAIPVDVDGDGNVEVVAVSSFGTITGGVCGVFVYGDANDQWVQSRGVWNQHSYHITNVNDDGTIPVNEVPSWTSVNSYRSNRFTAVEGGVPVDGCAFAKPDLTASFLRIDTATATGGAERRLTARIGNAGNAVAGAGTPVSFYDGNPLLGGRKLATTALSMILGAGSFEDVEILVDVNTTTESSIWVVADDFGGLIGTVSESDEDNNAFDSGLSLVGASGAGLADLAITSVDTTALDVDSSTLDVNISGTLAATVRNQGELAVSGPFDVVFFEDANANGTYEAGVDVLLGVALVDGATPVDVDGSIVATAPASGSVLFAGNLIYAFADSGLVVTESNETNNLARSGADSVVAIPAGTSDMTEEWSWTSSSVQPTFRNISTTPVVADLTGDGVADIVFVTFAGTNTAVGYLRAVDGATRQELFTADDSNWRVYGLATPALGDLDGNGVVDIVAVDDSRREVLAFEWDTALSQLNFKWKSPRLPDAITRGAVSIADLDGKGGDGQAEILFGRQVLNSDGTLRFSGTSTRRGDLFSPLSVAVDLDGDGVLEVVTGDVAYTASGTVFWDLGIDDGYIAVGNFDTDPEPELVHLDPSGRLRVLEHDGTVKWGPVNVPGNGFASPPTVADVDADGRAEIIVATRDLLTVFETGGFVRFSVPITHTAFVFNAGAVTAAFDFDGDGASELVYHDETGIHIYSGRDGSIVDEALLPSCHRSVGYVSVADVDGDGASELVAGFNDTCAASTNEGLHIFGDAGGNWVRTRALWNQHNYHVTNVDDDGGIPATQVPSWTQNNSFRHQTLTSGSIFLAVDLTASFGRLTEDGTDLVITVRIGNGGAAIAPAGIPVSLYNGNPALGFPLLTTVNTTSTLEPGSFEDVSFQFPNITFGEDTLFAVADDDGTMPLSPVGIVVESNEDNNAYDTGLALNFAPVVDAGEDVVIEFPDATTTLQGSVSDDGLPLGASLTTRWEVRGGPLGSDLLPPLFVNQSAPITDVTFQLAGPYLLRLVADDSRARRLRRDHRARGRGKPAARRRCRPGRRCRASQHRFDDGGEW